VHLPAPAPTAPPIADPPATGPAPGSAPRAPARYPGRRPGFLPPCQQRAVDAIRDALRTGRSALVLGAGGVGKTHVVGRVLDGTGPDGRRRPLVVAPCPASADGGIPWVVTVSGAAARSGIPLAALEPLLGDEGLLAVGSFARTVRALAASLHEGAAGRPVVLRVEDAHLLDPASADAVAWVARQGQVLLVATSRPAAGAASPWLELWKDGVVERVDIAPFTPAELEQWLVAELGGQVTADSVHHIWSDTGGNVFHSRELVRAGLATGRLGVRDGVWVWTGRDAPADRLLELIDHDSGRLSPAGRQALEAVALLGPVPVSLVVEMTSRGALDELVRAGIANVDAHVSAAGGSELVVDVAHALYGAAVGAGVPRQRRREILARAAVAADLTSGAALVRSVTMALDCGLAVAPERVRDAIAAAFTLERGDTVVRLVDTALRGVPRASEAWADLMLRRADAWWALCEPARAERDAREVCGVLRREPQRSEAAVAQLVAATLVVAAAVHHRAGDTDAAASVLDEARGWLERHVPRELWEDELTTARLVRLGVGGRHHTRGLAVSVLANPRLPSSAVPLVCPTVIGLAHDGRFGDAAALCASYLPVAAAHADRYPWAQGEITFVSRIVRLWSGEIDEAEVAGPPHGDARYAIDWVAAQAARGLAACTRGAWSQAASDLRAANVRLEAGDRGGLLGYTLAAEALARAASGAAASARRLLAAIDVAPLRTSAVFDAEVRLLRVDALAWLRDTAVPDRAVALAGWARERGLARVELEALHRYARAGGAGEVAARVEHLGSVVEGPRAAALVAHVAALVGGDPDLVGIAERELNRCGLWMPPVEPPIVLTPREREIAALAAGGVTSRAIAARLTLSVRTVDSHLARVFLKTGVHSREGLSAVLR
jgi:DNA-binding CsgD family transcriptional regulator